MLMNPGLIKNMTAAAPIAPRRFVKFAATEGQVEQATADSDTLYGVVGQLGAKAAGDRLDVTLTGLDAVEYGGIVAQGDKLTADADGKAIKAAPGAGVTVQVMGIAQEAGVAGVIGSVLIDRHEITG